MRSRQRLRPDAAPMLALRALGSARWPLTEREVRQVAGYEGSRFWHAPLEALVGRGLAERIGARGDYRWRITNAGREMTLIEDVLLLEKQQRS